MMTKINRKKTKTVKIGSVPVGGYSPITVQSMTNTKTDNINDTIAQIIRLEKGGCDIVRVAVPNQSSAIAIRSIKKKVSIPIVADIHFDYRLAIQSARYGADAIRFNPGNIGNKKKVKALISCAKDYNIPIRIGVNAGSLEKDILDKYKGPTVKGMVDSALRNILLLQELDFHNIKISVKASDVSKTLDAYRLLSSKTNLPLHLGVTEAGRIYSGIIKSSIAIGALLADGIGDTIRVSLTCDPIEEVRAGLEILKALSIRRIGPEIISCPTCGRCEINLFKITDLVEKAVSDIKDTIKIAIMGCIVNGPGEAREADIGIAGGRGKCVLFKKGRIVKKVPENKIIDALLNEINEFKRV